MKKNNFRKTTKKNKFKAATKNNYSNYNRIEQPSRSSSSLVTKSSSN